MECNTLNKDTINGSDEKIITLKNMNLPYDVKRLTYAQCNVLCDEIRAILIDTVSKNGGHLASNLGTVELTVAIHRVFNSPKDKIVWDVGHQTYTHKLLTGRYDKFDTLRKENGISGFPKPSESVHDSFVCGHSSTSISLACGMAQVMKLNHNTENYAVAIIGDGAFTGGMAYEGLNNGGNGNDDLNLIIILNQNDMSISQNTGGFADYLNSIRQREEYVNTKLSLKKSLDRSSFGKGVYNFMSRSKNAIKGAFLDNNIFEALGYIYIGIVDGHNVEAVENALRIAKLYHKPVVVHVHTIKGKGYKLAEENPDLFHGISSFDLLTGEPTKKEVGTTFSQAFGKKLVEIGEKNSKVCAITAAMRENTGLSEFAERFPDRFFDVGIAEQHAVTFASGMASMGIVPVFAVYSTFLQRSYDQIIHDVAIAETHVVLAIDRAGIVGADGETHQGIFDVAFLTTVPKCVIFSPSNVYELNVCLEKAVCEERGLVCVRYPRGVDDSNHIDRDFNEYSIQKHIGAETLLVTYGRTYNSLYRATEKLNAEYIFCDILKLTKIFPIPHSAVESSLYYKKVIFFEEGIQSGGLAEHFLYELVKNGYHGEFEISAIDGFVSAGSVESCLARYNLTTDTMYNLVKKNIKKGESF